MLHVLDKVDAAGDSKVRAAADEMWRELKASKPQPDIFWRFIDEDRNLILKEYQHRAGQSATVFVGVGSTATTYHMNSGPFIGEDPRQMAGEALDWLSAVLDDIEARSGAA